MLHTPLPTAAFITRPAPLRSAGPLAGALRRAAYRCRQSLKSLPRQIDYSAVLCCIFRAGPLAGPAVSHPLALPTLIDCD